MKEWAYLKEMKVGQLAEGELPYIIARVPADECAPMMQAAPGKFEAVLYEDWYATQSDESKAKIDAGTYDQGDDL